MLKTPLFLRWIRETVGTALTETVVLFPILISLMMACFDLGQGVTMNQKVIGASQIMADLVARHRSVDTAMLTDITAAGRMALEPGSTVPFGYDIVSVQFDADGDPEVLWRVTQNMAPNDDAVASTEGLGASGDGIVVVTASYNYDPYFTNFLVEGVQMEEVAFLRGRRSSTVACTNCP